MNRYTKSMALGVLLSHSCLATPAAAQGVSPPPRQDSVSPTGVSYKSGSFSYSQRDLSIGGGDFPKGLSLDRTYQSGTDGSFSDGLVTQGWTHNLVAMVTNKVVPNKFIQPPQGQEKWLYSISIGGRSVGFGGGSSNPTGGFVGTYQPATAGGKALVYEGTEQNGHFTSPTATAAFSISARGSRDSR